MFNPHQQVEHCSLGEEKLSEQALMNTTEEGVTTEVGENNNKNDKT